MKNNIHKKIYSEDKFARRYYCNHARLNQIRFDKECESKAWRNYIKEQQEEQMVEMEESEQC